MCVCVRAHACMCCLVVVVVVVVVVVGVVLFGCVRVSTMGVKSGVAKLRMTRLRIHCIAHS